MEDDTPRPMIDRYELLDVLREGKNGMATVYKARHVYLDTIVALKVIPLPKTPEPQDDEAQTGACADRSGRIRTQRHHEALSTEPTNPHKSDIEERFSLEIRALGKLRGAKHPNIVEVYDAGISQYRAFLAMEYINGQALGSLIDKEKGTLPPHGLVLRACRDTANALTLLHHHRLVHRDVKPLNIMVTDGLEFKLIDLGIAKDLTGQQEITRRHHIDALGTEPYMAPEQFGNMLPNNPQILGPWTDIWGLAKTLVVGLTGIDGTDNTGGNYKRWQAYADFVPPLPTEEGAYADCYALLRRMLVKNPAQRISSARMVQEALDLIIPRYENSTTSNFDFAIISAALIAKQEPKVLLGQALFLVRPDIYTQITGERVEGYCDPSMPPLILSKVKNPSRYRTGRFDDNDFQIVDKMVSRHHLDISVLYAQLSDTYVHLQCVRENGITHNGALVSSAEGKTGDVIGFSQNVAYVLSSGRHLHHGSRSHIQKHPERRAQIDTVTHHALRSDDNKPSD